MGIAFCEITQACWIPIYLHPVPPPGTVGGDWHSGGLAPSSPAWAHRDIENLMQMGRGQPAICTLMLPVVRIVSLPFCESGALGSRWLSTSRICFCSLANI